MSADPKQGEGITGAWNRTASRVRTGWRNARRIAIVILLLAVLAAVAFIAILVYRMTQPDTGADLSVATTLNCPDCELVLVTGVIDGDALDTNLGRVRLNGAVAPGVGEDCYTEAVEATRELAGNVVRAETGPQLSDPFDRRLFYLYTESGRSIDELLIRNGFALARIEDGQHRDLLLMLEREAAAADRGCLWN